VERRDTEQRAVVRERVQRVWVEVGRVCLEPLGTLGVGAAVLPLLRRARLGRRGPARVKLPPVERDDLACGEMSCCVRIGPFTATSNSLVAASARIWPALVAARKCFDAMPRFVTVTPSAETARGSTKVRCSATGARAPSDEKTAPRACSGAGGRNGLSPCRSTMPS
jgi:hypothetical protein